MKNIHLLKICQLKFIEYTYFLSKTYVLQVAEKVFADTSNFPAILYLGGTMAFGLGMVLYNPDLDIDPADCNDVLSDINLGPH